MTWPTFLVDGLSLRADDALAAQVAAILFRERASGPADRPSLVLQVRHDPAQFPIDLRMDGADPICVESVQSVHRTIDGFEVRTRRSASSVSPDGTIRAVVADVAPLAVEGFAATGALISLSLALRPFGLFHLHAAGLRLPGGRVAIVPAATGSGKTTLTLAAVSSGARYATDDTLFMSAGARGPTFVGLPRAFHVSSRTAAAFPAIRPHLLGAYKETHKEVLDDRSAFPGRSVRELPAPDVILCPEIVDAPTSSVARTARADGLSALLDSSHFVVERRVPRWDEQLALLREVAERATCFRVLLGRDLLADPAGSFARIERALDQR